MGRSEAMLACWLAAILSHALRCACQGSNQLAVPLGSTANITCSNVTPPSMRWEVKLNRNFSALRSPGDDGPLAANGITSSVINLSGMPSSVLHINATTSNNGTSVKCVRLTATAPLAVVLEVTLAIYEPPSSPTNLITSIVGNGTLVLKWQPPFAPSGVKLQYRVALSNLLTPSAPLEAVIVENCSYTRYLARELSQCLKYDISVFAVNRAGESEPIKAQVSLPAVPLIDAQQHLVELIFSRGDMAAYFKLYINQNCSDFPVQSYIVQLYNVLQDSTLTVKCQANTNNCSAEKIIIHAWDGLQQNMKYVYNITAVNVYGSTTTSPQTLYTTDVQSSTITGSDHQLNVTCFFAVGTLAKGCVVCLEKSGEFSVDCYNISVMDWEEDGSIGSLATQGTTMVAPASIVAASANTMTTSLTERFIHVTESTAFSSVPSTYSTHQALPSQLPPSSVSDSNKAQQMLWLISIVCSIAVALSIATIGTMCSVFLCRRVKAMKVKRDKTMYSSSEKEERIYEAVTNQQHPIYATLEPPRQISVTNPTYMINYETGYSCETCHHK
eukprot:Em0006g467a